MTCNDVKERTVAYLELDLDASLVRDITAHLEGCAGCREEMEALRQVLVRLKRRSVPDPGDRFWNEFPDHVRRQLAQAHGGLAPMERSPRRLLAGYRIAMRTWPMALAASVMLLVGVWLLTSPHDKTAVPLNQPGGKTVANAPVEPSQASEPDLPSLVEAHWEMFGDEDPDTILVDMAARLDQRTVDRLFGEI